MKFPARDRKQKHPLVDNFKIPVTSKLLQVKYIITVFRFFCFDNLLSKQIYNLGI